ncbi:hypothetical protein [Frisingicoccus sp.]|uniref:hypothetical protein n=1 Tax=Frisingicoccus sp. TaxID=1918627 RepID=UPI003AB6CEDA
MKKIKKNLSKKEYRFSGSYYRRKKALLKRMFGRRKRRKNGIIHGPKSDDILL